MNRKMGLMAAAILLLAVVAVIGWTRKSEPESAATTVIPSEPITVGQPVTANVPATYPASYNDNGGYYGGDNANGYVQSIHPPVVIRSGEVAQRNTVEPDNERDRAVYSDERYREREVRHSRSTKKSVAIVAGSAAGGALIGGLAGGGKGAGIGALAGGGAGFIYDRLTHNHH